MGQLWNIFQDCQTPSPLPGPTILQILLSSCPYCSPLRWPVMEWIMVRMKICLALHHSGILRLWEWSLLPGSNNAVISNNIWSLSGEIRPSNIGFRISNKWAGEHGKYITPTGHLILVIPGSFVCEGEHNINFSSSAHILTWLASQECKILWSEIRKLKSRQSFVITTSGEWQGDMRVRDLLKTIMEFDRIVSVA